MATLGGCTFLFFRLPVFLQDGVDQKLQKHRQAQKTKMFKAHSHKTLAGSKNVGGSMGTLGGVFYF